METHMKKAYILISVLLLAAVGCNRENVPGTPDSAKKLTITAGASTRSHFDTDGLTLLWDEGEKLAVYSVYVGKMSEMMARVQELMDDGVRAGHSAQMDQCMTIASFEFIAANEQESVIDKFTIDPADAGKTDGRFTSERDFEDWFGVTDPTEDDHFTFTAFYPAPTTPKPLSHYHHTNLIAQDSNLAPLDELDAFYVPVEIPAVQDGRSYWKYQLLFGKIDEDIQNYPYFDANRNLHISGMAPVTSMLAFTIQLAPDAEVSSADIARIDIRVETEEVAGQGYVAGHNFVAGELPYFPAYDERYEIRLWNRITKPYFLGNNRSHPMNNGTWDVMANASSSLSLQFNAPVTVSKTAPTTETFYAILAPTNNILRSSLLPPRYIVSAYNAAGEEILFARLLTTYGDDSLPWGLEEGYKYTFNLVLGETATDLTMDAEAGQYITELW